MEYIEREAAIEAAKNAWEKGLEPAQYDDGSLEVARA